MSMVGGKIECDGCGKDLGNGDLLTCFVVSRIAWDEGGLVENLHLCYEKEDKEDGKVKVAGCGPATLNSKRLAAYSKRRTDDVGSSAPAAGDATGEPGRE